MKCPSIIVDLEGTCFDDQSIPDSEREIIEFGAVALSGLESRGEFAMFVRPHRHPTITNFCRGLTGICQEHLNAARSFPEVFANFQGFCWDCGELSAFASWGTYDRDAIARDCRYHQILNTFTQHFDLSKVFGKHTGRRMGHRRAMKHLGIEPDGRQHRGIDDTRNIVKIVREFYRKGWL